MSMRTQLAYVAAVVTLLYGLFGLIFPLLSLHFAGLQVTVPGDPRGIAEARAIFGGLFIMLGFLMLASLPTRPRPRAHNWLRASGYLWLAIAGGQLIGLIFDGVTLLGIIFFIVEALLGLAALGAGLEQHKGRPADGARRY